MATKRKSTKYYEVKLPVKPYIKKFVASMYGDTIRICHSSSIGFLCFMALEKKCYHSRFLNQKPKTQVYEESITLSVNKWQYENIGFDFSPDQVYTINTFLENSFWEALYMYCVDNTRNGLRYKGYKQAIHDFCDLHDIIIEYDIKYDTLKRRELRYRMRREEFSPAKKSKIYFLQNRPLENGLDSPTRNHLLPCPFPSRVPYITYSYETTSSLPSGARPVADH